MPVGPGLSAFRVRHVPGCGLDAERGPHRYHSVDADRHGDPLVSEVRAAARRARRQVAVDRPRDGRLSAERGADAEERQVSLVHALHREARLLPAARRCGLPGRPAVRDRAGQGRCGRVCAGLAGRGDGRAQVSRSGPAKCPGARRQPAGRRRLPFAVALSRGFSNRRGPRAGIGQYRLYLASVRRIDRPGFRRILGAAGRAVELDHGLSAAERARRRTTVRAVLRGSRHPDQPHRLGAAESRALPAREEGVLAPPLAHRLRRAGRFRPPNVHSHRIRRDRVPRTGRGQTGVGRRRVHLRRGARDVCQGGRLRLAGVGGEGELSRSRSTRSMARAGRATSS